jgi:hypothetical protein
VATGNQRDHEPTCPLMLALETAHQADQVLNDPRHEGGGGVRGDDVAAA